MTRFLVVGFANNSYDALINLVTTDSSSTITTFSMGYGKSKDPLSGSYKNRIAIAPKSIPIAPVKI